MADPATLVRRYYEALDGHEYDRLADLLDPSFVQRRPDRTFEGREAFVAFMRDDRPATETSHELVDVIVAASAPDADTRDDDARTASGDDDRVATRGRLLDAGGEPLLEFADHFRIEDGRIAALDTYTR